MRPRFAFSLLFLVAVIIAIVFAFRLVQSVVKVALPQRAVESANGAALGTHHSAQNMTSTKQTAVPTNPQGFLKGDVSPQVVFNGFVDRKNVPIEFYGQFIDQDSNAISGASIKVVIVHLTMPDPLVPEIGSKDIRLERTSDSNGRVEISGETGQGFDIASVQKVGYELEPGQRTFGAVAGSYDNPVIFKMWNTNVHEKLIAGTKSFHILPDGRPYFINLNDASISESGNEGLKIWIKRPERITFGQRYNWSCEINVIHGGLSAATDYAMYYAPTSGYVPSFHFEQTVGSGWGASTGERRFYVMFNNGQEYGHITVELYAYYNEQIPGMIRLSYVVNHSGSRILR